jgi:hypothetical protein
MKPGCGLQFRLRNHILVRFRRSGRLRRLCGLLMVPPCSDYAWQLRILSIAKCEAATHRIFHLRSVAGWHIIGAVKKPKRKLIDPVKIGAKGGKARARSLTAEERAASARKAALARWGKAKKG